MERFAVISTYPRSIAWLVCSDDWDSLEKIVKYNCAMLGGYYNIIIPVDRNYEIPEEYMLFILNFDPDIVVLAKGQSSLSNYQHLHPFAVINWDESSLIATLNPFCCSSGMNAPMPYPKESRPMDKIIIAIEDNANQDYSRLAFMACGDIEPEKGSFDSFDGEISFYASGYRDNNLRRVIRSGIPPILVQAHEITFDKMLTGEPICVKSSQPLDMEIVPAPDRCELANLIEEENQFPLKDVVKIIDMCCQLQHFPLSQYLSFINMTASYKKFGGTAKRHGLERDRIPGMAILLSDHFTFENAVLYWNLRASEVYVAWLSFSDLKGNLDAVAKWIDSDFGGVFYSIVSACKDAIWFSSSNDDRERLQSILIDLKKKVSRVKIRDVRNSDLMFYDYIKPHLSQESAIIAKSEKLYSFIPKLPNELTSGIFVIELEWSDFMLPQNDNIIKDLVSSDKVSAFRGIFSNRGLPRFRIVNNHFIRIQTNSEKEIRFRKPSAEQIVETIFNSSGFSKIEPSINAKYHHDFIKRAGGFEEVSNYLIMSPFKELFSLLSDRKNNNKPGWILKNLDRRVLNHLQLRHELGEDNPIKTKEYFETVCDELPDAAIELLEKGILERGFKLKCDSCSFESWYPIEQVTHEFKCSRCYNTQVYKSNPLWLYKLAEVTFQGFNSNMDVPLLALNCLRRMSNYNFEWVPDLDIYWHENEKEIHKNIDIICIIDGKLCIGEAKNNDKIEHDQFKLYETIAKRISPNIIVFATSKANWSPGTNKRIKQLEKEFNGEVLILTKSNLYST